MHESLLGRFCCRNQNDRLGRIAGTPSECEVCADLATPTHIFIRGDGSSGSNGWATSPAVETELAAWFDATTLEVEKAAARRLNKAALDHALFAPLGVCMRHYAWRKNLTGISKGSMPLFWGVSKTV